MEGQTGPKAKAVSAGKTTHTHNSKVTTGQQSLTSKSADLTYSKEMMKWEKGEKRGEEKRGGEGRGMKGRDQDRVGEEWGCIWSHWRF